MITKDEIVEVLEGVQDPHVPVSLRSMRMLEDVEVDGAGGVRVQVCMPCMACPAAAMITSRIEETLLKREDVSHVVVELGWHLSWDRDAVDDGTRELMRKAGIQL